MEKKKKKKKEPEEEGETGRAKLNENAIFLQFWLGLFQVINGLMSVVKHPIRKMNYTKC